MKKSTRWSDVLKVIGGLGIAGGGLYIFLKDVDIRQLGIELKSITAVSVVVCCILALLTLYVRSLRWNRLLPRVEKASKKNLFSITLVGFMLNNIFPGRIGEPARALMLWRYNRYSPTISFGTLVIERTIDTLIYLLFFIVPVVFLPRCASLGLYALVAAAVVGGVLFGIFVYIRFPVMTRMLAKPILFIFPHRFHASMKKMGKDCITTLWWLHAPRQIVSILSYSVVIAGCYVVQLMLLSRDIGYQLGIFGGMFVQAYAAFGAAIPLSPGFVGTIHATMLQGISILGANNDAGRAIAIVYHAINFIPVTLVGLFYFFRLNLSIKEIIKGTEEMEERQESVSPECNEQTGVSSHAIERQGSSGS